MSHVVEVSVDEGGHLIVPADVSAPLGLSPGMTLIAEEADAGAVRLRVQSEAVELVEKGGVLVVRGLRCGDIENAVELDRLRRIQAVSGMTGE